jgi:ATP-dependent exoDNAse (exonuclease V) beta subunit
VHALLEWSQANGWQMPTAELVQRIARSGEIGSSELGEEALLAPFRAWLNSSFFAERIKGAQKSRAEVPLLIEVADTVLRGSIDLLVEQDEEPPLIVDYKTDRVDGTDVSALTARYEIQQTIYALAVAEALEAPEVELAYVFLERPEEPFIAHWGPREIAAGRQRLETEIERVRTV